MKRERCDTSNMNVAVVSSGLIYSFSTDDSKYKEISDCIISHHVCNNPLISQSAREQP